MSVNSDTSVSQFIVTSLKASAVMRLVQLDASEEYNVTSYFASTLNRLEDERVQAIIRPQFDVSSCITNIHFV